MAQAKLKFGLPLVVNNGYVATFNDIVVSDDDNTKLNTFLEKFSGGGSSSSTIEWDYTSNANNFIEAGTYKIKGERTGNMLTDNLPIMNSGSGHTIDGILVVLDSSLANGSGNTYDCTITQFLMLSNRVGGQEGDMYMRSAYGATKDNLTWKSWEKYQTNVEVGAVNNHHTLNPSNPIQAISYGGMDHLKDNGIYSGIYFPPKAMIGTPSDGTASIVDATAIETFVMVVINNYAAAGDAVTVTQIKYAVTNGGVFSMEKRTGIPDLSGSVNFSSWDSINSGSDSDIKYEGETVYLGSNTFAGKRISIGKGASIGGNTSLPPDLSFSTGADGLTIRIGSQSWTISNIG